MQATMRATLRYFVTCYYQLHNKGSTELIIYMKMIMMIMTIDNFGNEPGGVWSVFVGVKL